MTRRQISHIPMFELPKPFGNAVYESTYSSDYQKRRSLETFEDDDNSDPFMQNKSLSQSLHDLSLLKHNHNSTSNISNSDPLAQPLYKTNKYGLLPIHRSKKIDGVNYFRSQMDPQAMRDAKKELETRSLYNFDYTQQHKAKIPNYIKKEGYYHTNSEKNVRYLHSYNGALIPYIPPLPLNKRPIVPPIRTDVTFNVRAGNIGQLENKTNRHYEKTTDSSKELDKYFTNLQYHQRDISPPRS